jgi:hypothetical protein
LSAGLISGKRISGSEDPAAWLYSPQFAKQLGCGSPAWLILEIDIGCCPLWSRTTKQAERSSTPMPVFSRKSRNKAAIHLLQLP